MLFLHSFVNSRSSGIRFQDIHPEVVFPFSSKELVPSAAPILYLVGAPP